MHQSAHLQLSSASIYSGSTPDVPSNRSNRSIYPGAVTSSDKIGPLAGTVSFPNTSTPASTHITPPATSMSFRYYQPPKPSPQSDSNDSSEEDSDEYYRRGSRKQGSATKPSSLKRTGACTHCKSLKVKCHFASGQEKCQRCILTKLDCAVYGRKKRRAVATHEELILRSHRQDIEIAQLLKQFDQLTMDRQRTEWLSKAHQSFGTPQSSVTGSPSSGAGREALVWPSSQGYNALETVGYSSHAGQQPSNCQVKQQRQLSIGQWLQYFPDASVHERSTLPEIATAGLVMPDDVMNLFKLYFKYINPNFSLLDPDLHGPARLLWHSEFLFTVICTLAARIDTRYYFDIYPALLEFKRGEAGKALVQGKKTLEDCQAFLLCAVYQPPRKKWEDQRGWLHMGIAFTLAQELKLSNPDPEPGMSEREHVNRIRTWLNCYCVDWSHATQFGKPAMISMDDFTARFSREWYHSSRYSQPVDVHLVAYCEMLRKMGHFKKEVGQANLHIDDILLIVYRYNDELIVQYNEWSERFAKHPQADAWMCRYRSDLNRMINGYNRLVILSYGFQKAVTMKGISRDDRLIRMCISTAYEVIFGMTRKLYQTGKLKYSMDAHLLFVTFAAGFLLNLLNPKFSILLLPKDSDDIIYSVVDLVKVLQSDEVKLSERHAPALYARYLTKQLRKISPEALPLLESPLAPVTRAVNAHSNPIAGESAATWNPIEGVSGGSVPLSGSQAFHASPPPADDVDVQLSGFDMDFSLPYFVQMVTDQARPSPPHGGVAEMWLQDSYPINNSIPPAYEWPMAADGQVLAGR